MAPEVSRSGQTTVIVPQNARFRPLGAKIRKLDYIPPEGLTLEDVRLYLYVMREEAKQGDLSRVPFFYEGLGLNTANLENFKDASMLIWREFEETVRLVANRLLAQRQRQRALDFLRPLTYREIPEDPDHVWGYPLQSINHTRFPSPYPSRCAWRYLEENAIHLLNELDRDLIESFERRSDPSDRSAANQCYEPYQPMRYRLEAGIAGPDEVEEGGELVLRTEEVSQFEYGEGYGQTEAVAPERGEWNLDTYTCQNPPAFVERDGHPFVLQIPTMFEDCAAVVSYHLRGPFGNPVVAQKRIEILNTDNEAPAVRIRQTGHGESVKLTAIAQDPDGDPLTYQWEQIDGPKVKIRGDGRSIQFTKPLVWDADSATIAFRVTVTDQPRGKRAGPPKSATAIHRVSVEGYPLSLPEPTVAQVATDPKRKGVAELAKKTGGTPRVATSDTLLEKIKEAVVPDHPVQDLDIVFVVDASASMIDDIERVQARVPQLLAEMQAKIKNRDSSRVRVSIVSYVDDEVKRHTPLVEATPGGMRSGLDLAMGRMLTSGGWKETIWDALYLTLAGTPWTKRPGAVRKIVYLTDEGGNTGRLGKTKVDVDRLARRLDVVIEPIFFVSDDLFQKNKFSILKELLLKKNNSNENIYINYINSDSKFRNPFGNLKNKPRY